MTNQSASLLSRLAGAVKTAARWISQLLKTIWIFFPSLLFIALTIICFWTTDAGKDLVIAFTESVSRNWHPARLLFFIAIAFWVYVTWYSSRLIAYTKESWQQRRLARSGMQNQVIIQKEFEKGNSYFEIGKKFLDVYPRLAGSAAFLALELAVWQLPVFPWRIGESVAGWLVWVIFLLGMIVFYIADRWISVRWQEERLKRYFNFSGILFLILLVLTLFLFADQRVYLFVLVGMLFLFHFVYLLFINLRRIWVNRGHRGEKVYYRCYVTIAVLGLIVYCLAILELSFAKLLGPFALVIVAFAVILSIANVITDMSVRIRINLHLVILVFALAIGTGETHSVRTVALNGQNGYTTRPVLGAYLKEWLNEHVGTGDSSAKPYDMYFVLSDGGGSRSGYWTASILGQLEDSSMVAGSGYGRFSDHVFCLSGTSGGGVGLSTFCSMLKDRRHLDHGSYLKSARDLLSQDFFSYAVARMFGPDYLRYIFNFFKKSDRGRALEEAFEESSRHMDSSDYQAPFYANFSEFRALDDHHRIALPLLFINTTRMQDGNPGVVTNLQLDAGKFSKRIDVVRMLASKADVSLATGAILGARFPYMSPAGNLANNNYFVDGGYFDNSGAGVVQETIEYVLDIAGNDSKVRDQLKRVRLRVLHIENWAVGPDSVEFHPSSTDITTFKTVPAVENDLFSPLLTFLGTYNMQTTVNDIRLYDLIEGINKGGLYRADVQRISLYRELEEWMPAPHHMLVDTEAAYPINWFMSERTRTRIDHRLGTQPYLKNLLEEIRGR